MVEDKQLLSLDLMNMSLDNKEETTFRRVKERKTTKNYKIGKGQLKNGAKQEGSRIN
jgi:hypothetical protein